MEAVDCWAQEITANGQGQQEERRDGGLDCVVHGEVGGEGSEHVEGDSRVGPFAQEAGAGMKQGADGEEFAGAEDAADVGRIAEVRRMPIAAGAWMESKIPPARSQAASSAVNSQ